MNLHQIEFEETNRFSSIFLDYINNKSDLQDFYDLKPAQDSFEKAIRTRKFRDEKRDILVRTLRDQYGSFVPSEAVLQNIEALKDSRTFTITTGHQLNIFTGPLFFIYKVATAISMATSLNEKYPAYHFVPVYWMASEDHDFEEINNFRLFGKKYIWKSSQKGPVGKFETDSMYVLLKEIPELPDFCKNGYEKHNTLSEATRFIVNYLFGNHGLVILDADDPELKKLFRATIREDVFNNTAYSLARETTRRLEELGYKSQIFPRPVNLFYMENGLRERIEKVEGIYRVLNTSLSFSKDQMAGLIEEKPEKFSPNVVLRPVFQETVLPNLAYIGGPAEVTYWLQLKDVFTHFQLPFPIIFPRLFVLVISKVIQRKLVKLGLDHGDIFKDFAQLKDQLVYGDGKAAYDLSQELRQIEQVFLLIRQKSGTIDKSLEGFIAGEYKKTEKGIVNIQKRLKKATEQKEEVKINQLRGILDKLFPNGNPQEREDNFLSFYINNPGFIDDLISTLDPFSLRYNVLNEDVET
ncbi:MAG: bacillithiol biosynthesis cysteine-adding enzyme BshC [Cytophagales bacterium]|nr:bacillithiol biosynthesis cysteine-adding enzyme BshC [Cytophagales bacterium]